MKATKGFGLLCPVSDRRVDARVVRVSAAVISAGMGIEVMRATGWIALVLAMDLFVRGFTRAPSPLARSARALLGALGVSPALENAGAKIFAARLGFVMALMCSVFTFTEHTAASAGFAGVMMVFAGLEALCGVCVGCHVYVLLSRLGAGPKLTPTIPPPDVTS
jgi:hypothetical protein